MITANIEHVALLLLTAAVVAMLARKAHLPYTVGLLLTGLGLAFLPSSDSLHLSKDLIFSIFLPPLVFEAAFFLPWARVRRDLPVTVTLATVGVLLAAGLTALGMHLTAAWAWPTAWLFGVLISATDPVSVIATFKETPVAGRLKALVEAESLFNDGTAAVGFVVALSAVEGERLTAGTVAGSFLAMVLGGIVCGAFVASGLLLLSRRTDDHMVELTFSSVAAYGSFLLAEHFHLSGVLATLAAGLVVGNLGPRGALSQRGREAVGRFWEYAAFVVNSLVFLLIGHSLAHMSFGAARWPILAAIPVVLLGRALAVYPCCALFARGPYGVSRGYQHILFWGGLRGALALALVLGLPPTLPERPVLTTVVFAVVGFSIVVQGLTMQPLLARLGLLGSTAAPVAGQDDS